MSLLLATECSEICTKEISNSILNAATELASVTAGVSAFHSAIILYLCTSEMVPISDFCRH